MLTGSVNVNVVRGLRSTTLPKKRDNCLFFPISCDIPVRHRLESEPLILSVILAINHYVRDLRKLSSTNKVDRLPVDSGMRGGVQPFEATVTKQVSAQGISEVLEVNLLYVLLPEQGRKAQHENRN